MKLANHAALDGLCGEYLLGVLRGSARRRFERALMDEPVVALRLRYWQHLLVPGYASMMALQPSAGLWRRLEQGLGLARYRTPWYRRTGLWQGWAVAATAALALVVGLQLLRPEPKPVPVVQIAQLADKSGSKQVTAHLSKDGQTLVLHTERPVLAGPAQSYELWLIPVEGGDAISIAVLGSLDVRFAVPTAQVGRLRSGAKLAVSVEPAGGSPTGKATGPVIMIGDIKT